MLSRSIWLCLSAETRRKIAEIYSIGKSGGVEVAGNRVVSDGHTDRDLEVITVEALQQTLNSKEKDFYKLFYELVGQLERKEIAGEAPLAGDEVEVGELTKDEPITLQTKGIEILEEEKPKKRGPKAKK